MSPIRWRNASALAVVGVLMGGVPAGATPTTAPVTPEQTAVDARQRADAQAALLAAATAKIAELQTQVDDANAAAEIAAEVARNASADAETESARAGAAAVTAQARRAELGRWAAATYRSGSSAGASDLMALMRSENTDELAQNLRSQQLVGRWRGATSADVSAAADAQQEAAASAAAASAEAADAQRAAEVARQQATHALAAQQAEIDRLTVALTAAKADATAAEQQAAALAAQQAADAGRRQAANVPAANAAAQAAEVAALTPGSTNQRIIATAHSLQGIPYRWGGTTTSGFDCSGFTSYVYRRVGLSIPRTARQQQGYLTPVTNPAPGDLVFFGSPAHHVGIYAGGGMMYHSPRSGKTTELSKVHSGVSGYGRLVAG